MTCRVLSMAIDWAQLTGTPAMQHLLTLTLVALLVPCAWAKDLPRLEAQPLSPGEAADKVLKLVDVQAKGGDGAEAAAAKLRALAEGDEPDPWVIADELCFRKKHEAAATFAALSAEHSRQKLLVYIAGTKGQKPDTHLHTVLLKLAECLKNEDWEAFLSVSDTIRGDLDSVMRVRIARGRGAVLANDGKLETGLKLFRRGGDAAREMGWLAHAARVYDVAHEAAYQSDRWEDAAAFAELRLAAEIDLGNDEGKAQALIDMAASRYGQEKFADSLDHFEDALGVLDELEHYQEAMQAVGGINRIVRKEAIAEVLNSIGGLHHRFQDYLSARYRFEQSLELFAVLGDKDGIARAHFNLGQTYLKTNQAEVATRHFEQATRTYLETGKMSEAQDAMLETANSWIARGSLKDAQDGFSKAVKTLRARDQADLIPGLRVKFAKSLFSAKHYKCALPYFLDAAQGFASSNDPRSEARAYYSIGIVQQRLVRHLEALDTFKKAIEKFKSVADVSAKSSAWLRLGESQDALMDHKGSRASFGRALSIVRAQRNQSGTREVLARLADSLMDQMRMGEAKPLLDELQADLVIDKATSKEDVVLRAWTETQLGRIAASRSEREKSLDHARLALKLNLRAGSETAAASLKAWIQRIEEQGKAKSSGVNPAPK